MQMVKKVIKSGQLEAKAALAERVAAAPARSPAQLAQELGSVVTRKERDASARAEAIVEDAHAAAEQIQRQARAVLAEVEDAREQARQAGFAEGRETGLATVTEQLVRHKHVTETFYQQAEADIIRLVVQIAEKVIGRLVEEKADLIHAVVRQAIEASIGDRINVLLNPEDYRLVKAGERDFQDLVDRTRRLHFKEDESITRGGCIVETEVGTIDARLETQLAAIRKALEL